MAKYVVDLCKTSEHTDTNGITWWSDKFLGTPNVLKLYKPLEGVEVCEGITIVTVFEKDGIIKAYVEADTDMITGKFLSPQITGCVKNGTVVSVDYNKTTLCEVPLSENYATDGLKGFRLVEACNG